MVVKCKEIQTKMIVASNALFSLHIHTRFKHNQVSFCNFYTLLLPPFPLSNSSPEIIVSGFGWEPHCLSLTHSPPSFTINTFLPPISLLTIFSLNGSPPSTVPTTKTPSHLPLWIGDGLWFPVFPCFLPRLWGCKTTVWLQWSKAFLLAGFPGCLNQMNRVGFCHFLFYFTSVNLLVALICGLSNTFVHSSLTLSILFM